jgi:hypothetical protein
MGMLDGKVAIITGGRVESANGSPKFSSQKALASSSARAARMRDGYWNASLAAPLGSSGRTSPMLARSMP